MWFYICYYEKFCFACADFCDSHQCSTAVCSDHSYWISPKLDNKCGSMDAKICTALRKVWLSQHWFSWNSQTQWIFMEIICSEFYPNCLNNVENTGNIYFLSLSKACISVCKFSLNMLDELLLVRSSSTKFHENLTTSIVADTRLEADRHGLHIRCSFYLIKDA